MGSGDGVGRHESMGEERAERRIVGALDRRGDRKALEDLHLIDQRKLLVRHAPLGDRMRPVLVSQARYLDDVIVTEAADKKRAEGKTGKEALRALKRKISDAIYRQLQADNRRTSTSSAAAGREGNRGTTLHPARPAHTPSTGSSDKPLPDPSSAYAQPPGPLPRCHPGPSTTKPLDNKEELVRRALRLGHGDVEQGADRGDLSRSDPCRTSVWHAAEV